MHSSTDMTTTTTTTDHANKSNDDTDDDADADAEDEGNHKDIAANDDDQNHIMTLLGINSGPCQTC